MGNCEHCGICITNDWAEQHAGQDCRPLVDASKKIVSDIIRDFTDRRGLKQEWYNIDEDIQEEIKKVWFNIVMENLSHL